MIQRSIETITGGEFYQGFLGRGHLAKAVIDGSNYEHTDPFILLMDDRLNLPGGEPVGGPHPHAGFETVTFVLKGDGKNWETGSLEVMTAGKGIIHTEEITAKTEVHILQLWLALPPEKRWTEPFWQQVLTDAAPHYAFDGGEVRVYSGTSRGLESPLRNHTPFTLLDIRLDNKEVFSQELPADYNGFIYVIDGSVRVGDKVMTESQAGWFNETGMEGQSEIGFRAEEGGTRFIVYAARPHGTPIVSHGPFIGDTNDDIRRLYREYRQGVMPHLDTLGQDRKVRYVLPQE